MLSEKEKNPMWEGWEEITLGKSVVVVVVFLEVSREQGQCPLIYFLGITSEKVVRDYGSYRL